MTVVARVPLAGADLYDWIALRRVSGGGVVKLGEGWLEGIVNLVNFGPLMDT
ncbi:MAG: hypothetical protein JO115_00040 [Pseudonocardiales bacterium]|nr:hypothetical protein [Pseudonocardiales bacterium]